MRISRLMLFMVVVAAAASVSSRPGVAWASPSAAVTVGAPAPAFTLVNTEGKSVSLSDYKGKTVVLEWFNPDCPFIVAAHRGGPLEAMPGEWTEKGVVWLTINSNAEGKQGHGQERNARARDEYQLPTAVLLDEDGSVGKAYGAKTTPQMFVVDAAGTLVYQGGLDNAPRGEAPKTGLEPYLANALTAVQAGQPVKPAQTRPYGCSVKYGS